MKQFNYKARDKSGKINLGIIENISAAQAARVLQERGLLVITLSEKRQIFDWKNLPLSFGSGVSGRDVANFTRLLSTMLSTGLPLTDALSNLIAQTPPSYFREVLQAIFQDVQAGTALSVSMSRYPKVFDDLYVNLVKAGEASGKVDEALLRLADTLEANLEFRSKITGAMVYPAVIVCAMGAIGVFMITSIIPKIAEVYTEFGADLPLPTRILIGISDLLRNYTIFVALFFALLYFFYRTLRKNPASEFLINNALFRLPIFGPLNVEVTLAIICRTLGTLLGSGVAILEALRIVSRAVANNYFRAGLEQAAGFVEKGLPLSLALRRNPNFPPMISQLLAIGEETGTTDKSLERLAKFYQDAAERKVKTLTTLLEPLMILLMGGMVAGLALAVLLPMFNLVNVIK
jgi:type IV pilus assembly protein PilC